MEAASRPAADRCSSTGAASLVRNGDTVVVTINYRLGPFGFFAHPALADPDGPVAN